MMSLATAITVTMLLVIPIIPITVTTTTIVTVIPARGQGGLLNARAASALPSPFHSTTPTLLDGLKAPRSNSAPMIRYSKTGLWAGMQGDPDLCPLSSLGQSWE